MIDTPVSPLVLTKLRVPSGRPRLVQRAHLVDRLAPVAGTRLVLLVAPAGYGKSTLLVEWCRSLLGDGVAVAWYALDASDDEQIAFAAYLVASLTAALGSTPELAEITQRLRSSPNQDLQRILPAVINAVVASGRDCVLILDDYQLIGLPAIHSAIAYLLEHLPENMHIAIGSRAEPPLPLARLRARGQLLELRSVELRFTIEETRRFLHEVMRLELPPELVTSLCTRTEGWVAGLQLAALALTGCADAKRFINSSGGGHRYLVDYLLQEVVDGQSEEVQSFLRATSVLERMCAPLCDALLDETAGSTTSPGAGRLASSEAMLEQLERANLFVVALDDESLWYRYHHLFRDFLRAWLQRTQPERSSALHRAASEWYAAQGSLREAVWHSLQTKDGNYAAATVEQHGISLMLQGEYATVLEWCAALPEKVMRGRPVLCLIHANTLALQYRGQNQRKVEERLQQVERAAGEMELRGEPHGRLLLGQAATTRAVAAATVPRAIGAPRTQLALAQRALDLLAEDDPARSAVGLTIGYVYMALHDADAGYRAMEEARHLSLACQHYGGAVEATFHQARLAHTQGQLQRAAEICRQGRVEVLTVLADPHRALPALGSLDIALGCVLLEQDQLEEAEHNLVHGLHAIGWGMNPYYQMTACVAMYHLRETQGRPAEALEFVARMEEAWPDVAFCTRGLRVMHALRTAPEDPVTLVEAAAWCETFSSSLRANQPPPGMGPCGAAEAYYLAHLAWTQAQIALGRAPAALPYLERQLAHSESHGLTQRVIELSLLRALAAQAEGDAQGTWRSLGRALAAAQPAGYLRIFDQGPALNRLLIGAAERGIATHYIGRLLAAIGVPATPAMQHLLVATSSSEPGACSQPAFLPSGEYLSERELEVLRLIAQGATNQAIAEHLVITVGTVKSHINHILGKLVAHNRTEAVARARELGLPGI